MHPSNEKHASKRDENEKENPFNEPSCYKSESGFSGDQPLKETGKARRKSVTVPQL